jgi:transcription initiation factor TFIIIB Brf1 subunit/transcription initiation factor TFIIB
MQTICPKCKTDLIENIPEDYNVDGIPICPQCGNIIEEDNMTIFEEEEFDDEDEEEDFEELEEE